MAVESAADRATFTSTDEFGDAAVYTPVGGPAAPGIAGIFDDPSRTAAVGVMDLGTVDARPSFFCAEADLPGAADADAGDGLVVLGRSFTVTSIEPDGQGFVLIRLGAA